MKPKLITLKMKKLEIYNAGKENFFRYLALLEDYEKLRFENVTLINTLKTVLDKVDLIPFAYEDDALDDDTDSVLPKKQKVGVEIQ